MKKTIMIMSIVMALAVLAGISEPLYASAIVPGGLGGAYAPVNSTTERGTAPAEENRLITTESVGANPDRAYLRVTQEYQSNNTIITAISGESTRGSTYYVFKGIMPDVCDKPNTRAYICYEVYGGTTYNAVAFYDLYIF